MYGKHLVSCIWTMLGVGLEAENCMIEGRPLAQKIETSQSNKQLF